MNASADTLQRCPEHFSILLIGSTGDGKSATINHLLNTDTIKTGSYKPETMETVEYLIAVNNHDNEDDSGLKLGIIDTPGLNDPRGIKQDACNLNSMKHFFENHPLYSQPKCYPNIIFLVISANEHRIDGSNSKLAHTLRALNKLDVVDQNHPNVVAILTFCCSISYHNVQKWKEIIKEKKDIVSRNIHQALKIQAPVVLLENDKDSNSLEKSGDFTVLPNDERQPKNLYDACQTVLKKNGDHNGLSTFNIGLAQHHDRKKQYQVAYHKVIANDSSKNPISEVEQDLLNFLRGSSEDGKFHSFRLHFINMLVSISVVYEVTHAHLYKFSPLLAWYFTEWNYNKVQFNRGNLHFSYIIGCQIIQPLLTSPTKQ